MRWLPAPIVTRPSLALGCCRVRNAILTEQPRKISAQYPQLFSKIQIPPLLTQRSAIPSFLRQWLPVVDIGRRPARLSCGCPLAGGPGGGSGSAGADGTHGRMRRTPGRAIGPTARDCRVGRLEWPARPLQLVGRAAQPGVEPIST
jgi:hypothetical protein